MDLNCKQCGGKMRKTTVGAGGCGTTVIALCVALIGFLLLFAFPIGTLIGIVLLVVAARLGRGKKAWKCSQCGWFFERD